MSHYYYTVTVIIPSIIITALADLFLWCKYWCNAKDGQRVRTLASAIVVLMLIILLAAVRITARE